MLFSKGLYAVFFYFFINSLMFELEITTFASSLVVLLGLVSTS